MIQKIIGDLCDGDIVNIQFISFNDFLDHIHQTEKLNIELSSEFILFISTLMRIKAKMLL